MIEDSCPSQSVGEVGLALHEYYILVQFNELYASTIITYAQLVINHTSFSLRCLLRPSRSLYLYA